MCVAKGNDVNEALTHRGNNILRSSKKEIDVLIFNLLYVRMYMHTSTDEKCITITFDFHFFFHGLFSKCASFAVTGPI